MLMITLGYQFSPSWNRKTEQSDLASADEMTLRYDLFSGDQVFVVDGVDFSAKWGWIPLLDFAACLVKIVSGLEAGESELVFEFTESDAQLQFNRQGSDVLITSNYSDGKATVRLDELKGAVNSHAERLLNEALRAHPALKYNRSLMSWYPAVAKVHCS
jgi:hypothetical protein